MVGDFGVPQRPKLEFCKESFPQYLEKEQCAEPYP